MAKDLIKRSEVSAVDKWDLERIFKSRDELHENIEKLKGMIPEISDYQGKLDNAETIKKCFESKEKIERLLQKINTYTSLRYNEDLTNKETQADNMLGTNLYVDYSNRSSYITPEIMGLSDEKLKDLYESETLEKYRFLLQRMIDLKKHILSKDKEEAYASLSEVRNASQSTYSIFTNAELKFPEIEDSEGNKHPLSQANYTSFMHSKDRTLRKNAFTALHTAYGQFESTLASLLTTSMKSWNVDTAARGYSDPVEKALKVNDIPTAVFYNSLETVEKGIATLKRYVELKKKMLGLDEMHLYDLYVPLNSGTSKKYTFDEGVAMAVKGLKPLGEDYVSVFKSGIENGWIDRYPNVGKRSGAYSSGSYDTLPYISLNFNGEYNDVSTMVHEMGHSIHTWYSVNNQPYEYARYSIFLAEVASTCSEKLLIHDQIKNTEDRDTKIALLNQELEQVRTTVFRQLMFAEFEKITHEKLIKGEALTAADLDRIWLELNTKFYGDVCVIDDEIKYEWSRIPHFYNDFYVYQYATGFSAASSFTRMILEKGEEAATRYINKFLKAGASKYPVDVLKDAGVDMTSPQPMLDTIHNFSRLIDELEAMAQ